MATVGLTSKSDLSGTIKCYQIHSTGCYEFGHTKDVCKLELG
jgi:hypothetical protein